MNQRKSTSWCDMRQERISLDGDVRPVDDEGATARSAEKDREVLMDTWLHDQSWELYCANGFEHHRLELFTYQVEIESSFGQIRDVRVEASSTALNIGLAPAGAVESEAFGVLSSRQVTRSFNRSWIRTLRIVTMASPPSWSKASSAASNRPYLRRAC